MSRGSGAGRSLRVGHVAEYLTQTPLPRRARKRLALRRDGQRARAHFVTVHRQEERPVSGSTVLVDFSNQSVEQATDLALVQGDEQPRPDETPKDDHGPREDDMPLD